MKSTLHLKMSNFVSSIFVCFFLIVFTQTLFAQRFAVANGNWNSTATWSATVGGAGGATVPTNTQAVTINSGITVTVNAAANAASLVVNGTLNVNNASNNLTIANAGFVTVNNAATLVFNSTAVINGGGNGSSGITVSINSGANLTTANASGFVTGTGNSNVGGSINIIPGNKTITYNAGTNYIFNGVSQTLGNAITAANDLILNGSGTHVLATSCTVTNNLTLNISAAGVLSVGSNTLGIDGSIVKTSGTITTVAGSSLSFGTNPASLTLPNGLFTATPTITNLPLTELVVYF